MWIAWQVIANGYGVSFLSDENILKLQWGSWLHNSDYTKVHWIVYFACMIYELYFSKGFTDFLADVELTEYCVSQYFKKHTVWDVWKYTDLRRCPGPFLKKSCITEGCWGRFLRWVMIRSSKDSLKTSSLGIYIFFGKKRDSSFNEHIEALTKKKRQQHRDETNGNYLSIRIEVRL